MDEGRLKKANQAKYKLDQAKKFHQSVKYLNQLGCSAVTIEIPSEIVKYYPKEIIYLAEAILNMADKEFLEI